MDSRYIGGSIRQRSRTLFMDMPTGCSTQTPSEYEAQESLEGAMDTFYRDLSKQWRIAVGYIFHKCMPDAVQLERFRPFDQATGSWPLDLQLNITAGIEQPLKRRIEIVGKALAEAGLPLYRPEVNLLRRTDGSVSITGAGRLFGPQRLPDSVLVLSQETSMRQLSTHGFHLAKALLGDQGAIQVSFADHEVSYEPTFKPAPGVDIKARITAVLEEKFGIGVS